TTKGKAENMPFPGSCAARFAEGEAGEGSAAARRRGPQAPQKRKVDYRARDLQSRALIYGAPASSLARRIRPAATNASAVAGDGAAAASSSYIRAAFAHSPAATASAAARSTVRVDAV